MIEVTRFHNEPAIINAELIEMIEARPDTIITMTTGKKIIVTESVEEVVQKVIEYRQAIRPIIRTNVPAWTFVCPAKACPQDIIEGETAKEGCFTLQERQSPEADADTREEGEG